MEVTLDRQAAGVKNRTKSKNISRLLHMYFMSFVAVYPARVLQCKYLCDILPFFLVVNIRKPKTQHIQLIFFFYYLFELGMFVTFYMRSE